MIRFCFECGRHRWRDPRPYETPGEVYDYEAAFDRQLRGLPVRVQCQLPWEFRIGFATNELTARLGLPASRPGVSLTIVVPDGGEFTGRHMDSVRTICGGLINIIVTVKAGERATILGREFDRRHSATGAGVCEA